jgi:hypothetical protein
MAYALSLPVCGAHVYVAVKSPKHRIEHALMAVATFFLAFLAMALGRGEF